jgi:hypothetical protein
MHLLRGKRQRRDQHPWLTSAEREEAEKGPASLATICSERRGGEGSSIPGYHLLRGKRRRRVQHPWLPSAKREEAEKGPASLATIC